MHAADAIRREIKQRLGFVPAFFGPAFEVPRVLENLWRYTLSAYVDNPLPAVFKEKLLARAARVSTSPYAVVCHSCALRAHGLSAAAIVAVLETPTTVPAGSADAESLRAIGHTPWHELPASHEGALLRAAYTSFCGGPDGARARALLRDALGPERHLDVVEFLAYVRAYLQWLEAHAEISHEADARAQQHLRALVMEEPRLEQLFRGQPRGSAREIERPFDAASAAEPLGASRDAAIAAQYHRILEIAQEGVSLSDSDDRLTFVNRRLEQMFACEAGEMIGKSLLHFMDEESRVAAARHFARLRHGRHETSELRIQRSDGLVTWVMLSSSPMLDPDGTYTGALSMLTHITDAKRHEQALRDQNELFESMLRAQSDLDVGVAISEEERFVYVNDAFARICGYSVDEMLGLSSAFDLVAPEQRDGFVAHWYGRPPANPQVGTASHAAEVSFVHKSGQRVHLEYSVKPFHHGDREQRISVIRDVTERKQMQARVMLADRMASLGTLAAGTAHEINNPLAYVMANLDMMAEELRAIAYAEPSYRVRELETMVNDARQGAERVQKIVRGLRTFSRADEDRRVPLDVRSVLDLSINMAFNEIKHRARIVKDFGEVLPVEADETRLGQVFINLLVNAAHAIPEGNANRNEIRLLTRMQTPARVLVEVKDTGAGIAPNVVDRIFEPFFTTKPIGQGTGLGLSICHGIVTGLGGEITVESAPGNGSAFRVVLPVASAAAAPVPQTMPQRASEAPRRASVLVVDDEVMIGNTLRRILGKEHDVTVVTDGAAAWELLVGGRRFDVILCDLMMSQVTGIELHARVASRFPELAERMVFMTGGAFTPAGRNFLDTVPNQRLEKPFAAQNVRSVIRGFLR